MTIQNIDYYRQRVDEELAAAEQAGDPAIAHIHREMAQRYRDMMHADAILAQPAGRPVAEPEPV